MSEASLDNRLPPGTKVLAVQIGDEVRAYPVGGDRHVAVMDTLKEQELVVMIRPEDQAGQAFIPMVDAQALTFEVREGNFFDLETNSRWDISGRAVEGELSGMQLEAVPSKLSFWFAIVATEPGIMIYGSNQ